MPVVNPQSQNGVHLEIARLQLCVKTVTRFSKEKELFLCEMPCVTDSLHSWCSYQTILSRWLSIDILIFYQFVLLWKARAKSTLVALSIAVWNKLRLPVASLDQSNGIVDGRLYVSVHHLQQLLFLESWSTNTLPTCLRTPSYRSGALAWSILTSASVGHQ